MADAVVEVDHDGVRAHTGGRGTPGRDLTQAALDWIDDPVGLYDGRPVPTPRLWTQVLEALLGGTRCPSLLIVHPADWPQTRVRTVLDGARPLFSQVVAVSRDRWAGPGRPSGRAGPARRRPRRLRVLAATAAAAAVAGTVWVADRPDPPDPQDPPGPGASAPPAVSLVEGPVAVLIPADWTVQRHPRGPGSPRVRVSPPGDVPSGVAALNLTWSYAPQDTLAHAEEVLRRAAAAEPPGVFAFEPPGTSEGRPVVRYRERRPTSVVRWTVLIDGSTRIAVGCQSAPDREAAVATACALAVRSAREIPRTPSVPF